MVRNYKNMNILFVCLGNICRSPMAEFIAKDIIKKNKLSNIKINSCGTSGYHNGEGMHKGTKSILNKYGIDSLGFISKEINQTLVDESDYIIVMDKNNYKNVLSKFNKYKNKVHEMVEYSSLGYNEVPDPWYTGDFDEVYKVLSDAIKNLLKELNYKIK